VFDQGLGEPVRDSRWPGNIVASSQIGQRRVRRPSDSATPSRGGCWAHSQCGRESSPPVEELDCSLGKSSSRGLPFEIRWDRVAAVRGKPPRDRPPARIPRALVRQQRPGQRPGAFSGPSSTRIREILEQLIERQGPCSSSERSSTPWRRVSSSSSTGRGPELTRPRARQQAARSRATAGGMKRAVVPRASLHAGVFSRASRPTAPRGPRSPPARRRPAGLV